MENPKAVLFFVLGAVAVWFVVSWLWLTRKGQRDDASEGHRHTTFHAVVAFVCAFFDTLGIGCFAPTAAAFKFRGSVPDEKFQGL